MKILLRSFAVIAAIGCVSAAHAAPNLSGMDITVRAKSGGKVAYQGKTDASGKFATSQLEPGSYTLEVRSKNAASFKGSQVSIAVSAGKGSAVNQSTVAGAKFAGGVAMNIEVKKAAALQGQVSTGHAVASMADGNKPLGPGVKIIKGKRYVWLAPEVGSQMGGRWVPEDSPAAKAASSVQRGGQESLQRRQDHSGQGAIPGG